MKIEPIGIEGVRPEVLSNKKASDTGYIHEYLQACTIELKDERHWTPTGTRDTVGIVSQYPAKKIEAHLGKRASEGWRLISMEPHWYYHILGFHTDSAVTMPLAVVGWYLTFEKVG